MARNPQETQLGFEPKKAQKKPGFLERKIRTILDKKQIANFFNQIQALPEKDPDQPSEAEKKYFKKVLAKQVKKEEKEKAAALRANRERKHWKKVAKQSGLSFKKEKKQKQKQNGEGENWKKLNQDLKDAYAIIVKLPRYQRFAYIITEEKTSVSIGSAKSNDIILLAKGLAKHHAQLEFKEQCLSLKGPTRWRFVMSKPRFSYADIKNRKLSSHIIEPSDSFTLGQAEIVYVGFAEPEALKNSLFDQYGNILICELKQVIEFPQHQIPEKPQLPIPALAIAPQANSTDPAPQKSKASKTNVSKSDQLKEEFEQTMGVPFTPDPKDIKGIIVHNDGHPEELVPINPQPVLPAKIKLKIYVVWPGIGGNSANSG